MRVTDTLMVLQRVDLAKQISTGIDTFADEIAVGHADFLSPTLEEGETLFDTRQQLDVLNRRVKLYVRDLESLDVGVLDQAHDTGVVRSQLHRLAETADTRLRNVRHVCRGVFGRDSLPKVGLAGRFPTAALGLYRRCRIVQAMLRRPNLDFEPLFDFSGDEGALTPSQLAEKFEPELSELGRIVDSRLTAVHEDDEARLRRRQVVKDFDQGIMAIVLMLKGICRAAGREDLADQFRARVSRTARRRTDETEGSDEEAETPPAS